MIYLNKSNVKLRVSTFFYFLNAFLELEIMRSNNDVFGGNGDNPTQKSPVLGLANLNTQASGSRTKPASTSSKPAIKTNAGNDAFTQMMAAREQKQGTVVPKSAGQGGDPNNKGDVLANASKAEELIKQYKKWELDFVKELRK